MLSLEQLEVRCAPYNLHGAWPTTDLTYSLVGEPTDVERRAITGAFTRWAAVAPLHFTEVVDTGPADDSPYDAADHADIRVHFRQQFPGFVAGQAYLPGGTGLSGDVFLSSVSLPAVATHEIGHAIGLHHSDVPGAIMGATLRSSEPTLRPDDVAGVRALYGSGVGAVIPLRDVPPPYEPFPGFGGRITETTADVNGDGTLDRVFVAMGEQGHVKAESDGREVLSALAFPGFHGDVQVAGGTSLVVAAVLPDSVHVKVYADGDLSVSLLVSLNS